MGALLVFGLGLLNRFDVYPIASLRGDRSFISTLGNINWYCGFLAVFLPVGMGLLIRTRVTVGEQIFFERILSDRIVDCNDAGRRKHIIVPGCRICSPFYTRTAES